MAKAKPPRAHLRKLAIVLAALAVLAALPFFPPTGRALGGLFALSADGPTVAAYPSLLRRELARRRDPYSAYAQIPKTLDHALIAVEDKRFKLHDGIDPIALVRVLIENIGNDRVDHGGSTITLQLARMVLHIRRRQPSLAAEFASDLRMVRGALIIEHDFGKRKILALYFNAVYLGRGATGVAAAARAYFNTTLQGLSEAQCIYIAGLPQAPARFGADPSGKLSMARYRHVIATMERNGYLTKQQAAALDGAQLFPRLSGK